ncbi:MAG: TonB-dependent receptor [Saprospiraceae bacterium]|jgi:TonB-linked SusC/RagA family outer membrane protein|nr:TonB-dependent receptor [Saprospiraceae bacterium]
MRSQYKSFLNQPANWLILFTFLLPSIMWGQNTVTGVITDGQTQEPLIGVNVGIKNSNKGTITDFDGKYSLDVDDLNVTLVVSYIGYAPQEVPVNGRTELNIVLNENTTMIDEIVVVAYGTQRKSDVTGAVSSVKASELQRIPAPDLSTALQGKVAGLEAISSSRPGANSELTVRGTGTFNGSRPIYVVDGLILDDPANLSANEVESIEVLKDASAVALYGARGANGVILVTTKKGQSGKPIFSFNTYFGIQELDRKIALTNGTEYARLSNLAAMNSGNTTLPYPDPEAIGEGTDWQDVIYQRAPISSQNLSVRGGSDKMLYYISGEVMRQEGIVRSGYFDRYTLRINNEYKITSFLKFGHNLSANFRNSNGEPGGIVFNAIAADPTVPVRDTAGRYGDTSVKSNVSNPEAQLEYNAYNRGNEFRMVGNAYAELYLWKGITYRSSFGFDLINARGKSFVPEFFVNVRQQNPNSVLTVTWGNTRDWQLENLLYWNKSWTNHRLDVMVGTTAQDHTEEFLFGSKRDLVGVTEDLLFLNAAGTDNTYGHGIGAFYRYVSYLGRINYGFRDRYSITATFRRDGSSKFGKLSRYGNFPSIAASWRISEESFMPEISWLNNLKLRGSYGITGNDKIPYDRAFSTITNRIFAVFGAGSAEALNFGAIQTAVANATLQWEENVHTNVGIEFGLLNSRLTGEIDYFRKFGRGIITDPSIPAYVGSQGNPFVNVADVLNSGVEWNVRWRSKAGKVNYFLGATGNTLNNEVLSLADNKTEILDGPTGTTLATRTAVGLPIGAFFGYKVAGIYQNEADIAAYPNVGNVVPGDLRFEDVNGDGIINTMDRTFLGSPVPDLMYGFSAGADFMGIGLSVDLYGVTGNKIVNAKKMNRFFGAPNFEESFLDYWTGEGDSSLEPRVTNGAYPNYEMSERFLEDGSYFRIRNITLTYDFPETLLKSIRMTRLQIFASTTNPITWTSFSGYSPEVGGGPVSRGIDRGSYPVARVYSFGLNAGF